MITRILFLLVFIFCLSTTISYAQIACTNRALNFDGVDDFLQTTAPVTGNSNFTVEAWVNSTSTSTGCLGAFRRILSIGGPNNNRFEIGDCAGNLTLFIDPGAQTIQINNTNLRGAAWHHVAAVKSGSNLTVFLDGVQVLQQNNAFGAAFNAGNSFRVGRWVGTFAPGQDWRGGIDEVRVWNTVRTTAQIIETRRCELRGSETGLVLYYNFNQGVGGGANPNITTATDLAGTAQNSTLNGFALTGATSNWICSGTSIDVPCSGSVCDNDRTIPVITCPANQTVNTTAGRCDATVQLPNATATDNCPGTITITRTPTSNVFPLGTTNVIYTATDAAGNIARCTTTVTVRDNQAPTLTCPTNITVNAAAGRCDATVQIPNAIPADNCSGVVTVSRVPTSNVFPVGTTNVIFTATDAAGLITRCTMTVTVRDTERPVITNCPRTSFTIPMTAGQCTGTYTPLALAATDNCTPVARLVQRCTRSDGKPITDVYAKGSTTITCVMVDESGNASALCEFQVNIVDQQKPTIRCPRDTSITLPVGAMNTIVNFPVPTFADNCPMVTYTCTPASGSVFPVGTTTVSCVARDMSGNRSDTCKFTVTVIKNICDVLNTTLDSIPDADSCCYALDFQIGSPIFSIGVEMLTPGVTFQNLQASNSFTLTPGSQQFTLNRNPNPNQPIPAASYNDGATFCFGGANTSPQKVVIKYYQKNAVDVPVVICTDTITFNCKPKTEVCACGKWERLTLNDPINQISRIVRCDSTLNLECNVRYDLLGNYQCTGDTCRARYDYTLTGPTGFTPINVTGQTTLNLPLTFTISGLYTLTVNVRCGDKICPCVVKFRVTCPPIELCACRRPPPVTITANGATIATIACGNQPITLACPQSGSGYTFDGLMDCDGSGNCGINPNISWSLVHLANGPVTSGVDNTPPNFSIFIASSFLTAPGVYELTVTKFCGVNRCECKIRFIVPDCGTEICGCPDGAISGTNLVKNGDFSGGVTAAANNFTNDYTYFTPGGPTNPIATGGYSILSNAQVAGANNQWACTDHTTGTGNFLVVDGASPTGQVAWKQDVLVKLGTDHFFCFYANNLVRPQFNYDDPVLQVFINGVPITTAVTIPENPDNWVLISGTWTPSISNVASIEIRATTPNRIGNDFAIDDISFRPCPATPSDSCTCDKTSFDLAYAISRGPVTPVACKDTMSVVCDLAFNFYSVFQCVGPNCPQIPRVDWVLKFPNGTTLQTGTSLATLSITAATFTVPGTYTLTMTGYCGSDTCTCTVYFRVPQCGPESIFECGQAVVTCYAPPGDFVMGIMDIKDRTGVPKLTNWNAGMYKHPDWTPAKMGQVFGIAIDKDNNIYTTATHIYTSYNPPGSPIYGPAGAGGIYKISGVNGTVSTFVSTGPSVVGQKFLPNNGVGLGNICYDQANLQFFVTNFEDGKIYRIAAPGNSTYPGGGEILSVYDPFVADNGSANPTLHGERLWGIGIYNSRLYFSVWNQSIGYAGTGQNKIYSIAVSAGGFIGSPILEISLPPINVASNKSNPVSDIEFSSDGKMLLAERSVYENTASGALGSFSTSAHQSRVLEYTGSSLNWSATPKIFYIGNYNNVSTNANSAGGVDYGYDNILPTSNPPFDCDEMVWGTGDALMLQTGSYVYGIAGIPAAGNSPSIGTNYLPLNSYYVDVNANILQVDKTEIGDVDIFKCGCPPPTEPFPAGQCDSLMVMLDPVTTTPGKCCYKANIKNNLGAGIIKVEAEVITPGWSFNTGSILPIGFNFCPTLNNQTLCVTHNSGSIPTGVTNNFLEFCLTQLPGTTPPPVQQIVFSWYQQLPNGERIICRDTVETSCKPVIPDTCLALIKPEAICNPDNPYEYTFNFQVQNNTGYPVSFVNLNSITSGFSFSPCVPGPGGPTSITLTASPNPIPNNTTSNPLCVTIGSTTPILVPTQVCFRMKMVGVNDCCHSPITYCVTLNPCCSPCDSNGVIVDSLTVDSAECCHQLDLVNNCDYAYFTKVETEIITPGVLFGYHALGGPSAALWQVPSSSNTLITWQPIIGTIPNDTSFNIIQFCLDSISTVAQIPQKVVVRWITRDILGRDSVACTDTLIFDCPKANFDCVSTVIDSIVCIPDSNKYLVTMTFTNLSSFTADELLLFVTPPSTLSFSPSLISPLNPLLGPGASVTFTTCIMSSAGFPPTATQIVFEPRLISNNGDTCCFENTPVILPLPPCDTCTCGKFDFIYSISRQPTQTAVCGDTIGVVCGFQFAFGGTFKCEGADCPERPKVDWVLTHPILGTVQSGNNVPSFGFPPGDLSVFPMPGLYTLTMTGYCGRDTCSCVVYFKVPDCDCDPCEDSDIILNQVSTTAGKCCYTADLVNKCDSANFSQVIAEVITPGWSFNTVTLLSGYNFCPTGNNQQICVQNSSGNIPTGTTSNFLEFCLTQLTTNPLPSSTQQIVFSWYQTLPTGEQVICRDTVETKCEPKVIPDTCLAFINPVVTCNPDKPTEYTMNFQVQNNTGYSIGFVGLNSITSGFAFASCSGGPPTGSFITLPIIPSTAAGNPSVPLCVKIISTNPITAPTQVCFKMKVVGASNCCHSPITYCVTLNPCCNPCEGNGVIVDDLKIDSTECCHQLDLVNKCDANFFTKVETAILTSGVKFGYHALGGPSAALWQVPSSSNTLITWKPITGGIPVGTTADIIQFCLDNITTAAQVPQIVVVRWFTVDRFGRDSVACTDTMKFNCPPVVDYDCVKTVINDIVCVPDSNKYRVTMTFTNLSSFTADELLLFVTSPSTLSFSPSLISPLNPVLNPTGSVTFTTCIMSSAGFPPAATQIVFEPRLVSNEGDTCCFENSPVTIKLPPCDSCCRDSLAFVKDINQGFTISIDDSCRVTLTAPQFDSCHWFGSPPFVVGGSPVIQVITQTNGSWTFNFPQNGTYQICVTVYEGNGLEDVCWKGQMCTTVTVNCVSDCCKDKDAFFDNIAQGFQITKQECKVTVKTPQFDSCQFFSSPPDFGDGTLITQVVVPANGMWMHSYTQSGTYAICANVFEKGSDGRICWEGKMCDTVKVECRPGNCDSLDVTNLFDNSQSGACCWKVDLINKYSNNVKFIDINVTNAQLSNVMMNLPGWSISTTLTSARLFPPSGNLAEGSYLNAFKYCLTNITGVPQIVTIGWGVPNPNPNGTTRDTVICPEKFIIDCRADCKCGQYTDMFFAFERGQKVLTGCNRPRLDLDCAPAGYVWALNGQFACNGICTTPPTISWELYYTTGSATLVTSGSVGANPQFSISLPNSLFTQAGDYEIRMVTTCGTERCTCVVKIRMPKCTVDCICKQDEFEQAVAQGYSIVSTNPDQCEVCFQPRALTDCDEVVWLVNGRIIGTSIANQVFCHRFPSTGVYTVSMIVIRRDANGRICMGDCWKDKFEQRVTVSCSRLIGTDEIKIERSFDLHPNPTNNDVTLTFKDWKPAKGTQLQILDIHGRLLFTEPVTEGSDTHLLKLRELAAGLYLIKIMENNIPVGLGRVVKQQL